MPAPKRVLTGLAAARHQLEAEPERGLGADIEEGGRMNSSGGGAGETVSVGQPGGVPLDDGEVIFGRYCFQSEKSTATNQMPECPVFCQHVYMYNCVSVNI